MTILVHHSGERGLPTRTGVILRALLTLVLVTAIVAAAAGLVTYAVSRVLVSLLD